MQPLNVYFEECTIVKEKVCVMISEKSKTENYIVL